MTRAAGGGWTRLHSMMCQRTDSSAQKIWTHSSLGLDNPDCAQRATRSWAAAVCASNVPLPLSRILFYPLASTVRPDALRGSSVERWGWERAVWMGVWMEKTEMRRLRMEKAGGTEESPVLPWAPLAVSSSRKGCKTTTSTRHSGPKAFLSLHLQFLLIHQGVR